MPVEIKNSLNGGLDLDTSYFQLRKDVYVDALNITRDAVTGDDKIITNIVANRQISYTLPPGQNVVIGAKGDRLRNYVYYFVWNELGRHLILRANLTTRTITKVLDNLSDTGGVDILGWSRYYKINHIDILYREEGDLIFFVDGLNSPKKFNVDRLVLGTYGTVEADFISAAKKPPLSVAQVAYGNDATLNTNSLRKKLYKFKYRWIYDDFEKSTWSPESEVPLPANIVGTDVDNDPTKNNFISVQIGTGNKDVLKLQIAFRMNDGNVWGDYYTATELVKADNGISDNATYQFNFYNDGVYPNIDLEESNLLFDWVPKIAAAQCLANGNTLIYGAITENFDPFPVSDIDVEMSVENVKNTGVDVGPPSLTYTQEFTTFLFTVSGTVPTGTVYTVIAFSNQPGVGQFTLSTYTSVPGDTTSNVAQGLYNSTTFGTKTLLGSQYQVIMNVGDYIVSITVTPGTEPATTINTPTTWNYNDKHKFGLVYFDAYGRTNGVVYSPDFDVVTPNISISTGILETPVISASINHIAPSWAVKYMWVRTNSITYDRFLYYYTWDFQSDSDYYWFGLGNIQYFFDRNSSFIYGAIPFATGDRIKVMLKGNAAAYGTDIYTQDYEILGIEERTVTGSSPAFQADYVKVKKPITAPIPAYGANMLVMVYTPAKKTSDTATTFFEFGQAYDIYDDNGNLYHRGMTQDQTASQPALFTFAEGDVYYRQRNMFTTYVSPLASSANFQIIDSNYNDFYASAVNGNGRPEIIDVNARETYNPVLVRFGQSYQQGTNLNGMNRFYFDNFDEYDRGFGDITKLHIRDRYMIVGQKFKIGMVPVESSIIKTFDQQTQVFISDRLINPIQYYVGEYGCSSPESWAAYNFSIYFCDVVRGVVCRLSNDGITPISVLYKINAWALEHLPLRSVNTKAYGAYDPKSNNYILALEEIEDVDDASTIAFDEETNCFESFLSYAPEMMCVVGTTLVTFKDGALWTHDDPTLYNKFYGTQYDSSITLVFNENTVLKKKYNALSYQSNEIWTSPTNGDITTSFANAQTGLPQISQLKAVDYEEMEGVKYAALLRDANSGMNSTIALLEGDYLSGVWVKVKFVCTNTGALVYFHNPYLNYILSSRNL